MDKHSLGQRASALILFLLAQKDNDVLIIDQPEDDLDNQTIYDDVIKEIKKSKGNMQFIFATILQIYLYWEIVKKMSCAFDDNNISVQSGAIDSPQIQKDIVKYYGRCGDEAFNRRKTYIVFGT